MGGVSIFRTRPPAISLIESRPRAPLEPGYGGLKRPHFTPEELQRLQRDVYSHEHDAHGCDSRRKRFADAGDVPFWQLSSYIIPQRRQVLPPPAIDCSYYQMWAQPFRHRGHGASGRVDQFALLPLRGRAEDRVGGTRSRLSALRLGKGNRRLEQGRLWVDDRGGIAHGRGEGRLIALLTKRMVMAR